MALTTVKSDQIQTSVALAGSPTTTTQSASDNSTKIATTAYADTAVANLVASAPASLNTLDELAAALNDDASFSTTITNSIATKLPLAGGTLTGGLGIGAAVSTGYQLQLTGQSGYDDILRLTAVGTNIGARINLTNTGTGIARVNATNNSLALQTGGTTALTLDSSQNATFAGTVTAGSNITSGNDVFVPNGRFFRFTAASSSSSGGFLFGDSSGTGGSISFKRNSDSSTILHLDADGNVGIGPTAPGARLQINTTAGIGQYIYNTTSAQAYLALGNATTGVYSQNFSSTIAGVLVGVDSDESAVFWNGSNTRMRFGTNATGRMHITAGGNVLIGPETITPTVEFEVHGSNHLASFVNSSTGTNQYSQIQIKAGSALNWIWSANQNSTAWGGANSLNIQSTNGAIQFFTNGSTARMRIHESSGNVDIQNGNLVFANGHGIDFSATTEATGTSLNTGSEVLDDYEEGFWQPRPIGSTSGTSDYYYASQQMGSYIKIGNVVHLTWYVGVNDSSPTGYIQIANLPFAAKSGDTTNSKIVTGSCMWDGLPLVTGKNVIVPYMSHGAANLQFYQSGNNTGWVQTPVDTQWSMIGGITYRTT